MSNKMIPSYRELIAQKLAIEELLRSYDEKRNKVIDTVLIALDQYGITNEELDQARGTQARTTASVAPALAGKRVRGAAAAPSSSAKEPIKPAALKTSTTKGPAKKRPAVRVKKPKEQAQSATAIPVETMPSQEVQIGALDQADIAPVATSLDVVHIESTPVESVETNPIPDFEANPIPGFEANPIPGFEATPISTSPESDTLKAEEGSAHWPYPTVSKI